MTYASQESPVKNPREQKVVCYPDPLKTSIWNAILERATDVHLHWTTEGLRVLHRVDGIVHPKLILPEKDGRRLINQIKSASGLDVCRTWAPLEGNLTWQDGEMHWEIRVTVTPMRERESAHLRLLNVPRDQWHVSNLGLAAEDQDRLTDVVRSHSGLILITGGTGSGKTTTMYSIASLLDLRTTTTFSIEDPVEFTLPYVQQLEVDEAHGLSMYEGLRTILRMDPDLIMIGEIRDQDSAMVAARAALSGKLVLGTIHAQDAAGAVDALQYLGVPPHIIGSSLRMIVSQNLIRRLCTACAGYYVLGEAGRSFFSENGIQTPEQIREATGCPECDSYGYRGRMGIFEVSPVDTGLAAMISSGAHKQQLCDYLRHQGIRSQLQDGLRKVAAGCTSLEELFRICGDAKLQIPTNTETSQHRSRSPVGVRSY